MYKYANKRAELSQRGIASATDKYCHVVVVVAAAAAAAVVVGK